MKSLCITKEELPNHSFLSRLLELHDIPKNLYIKGTLPTLTFDEYGRATPRVLTIVGSRKNTEYGKAVLQKLLEACKGENIIILSGLALGIDGLAHREALKNNLLT